MNLAILVLCTLYYHTIQANRNVPDLSTRGVHTERSKRHVLWETKLPFIAHVSVSKNQDKGDNISGLF